MLSSSPRSFLALSLATSALFLLGCGDTVDVGSDRPDPLGSGGSSAGSGGTGASGNGASGNPGASGTGGGASGQRLCDTRGAAPCLANEYCDHQGGSTCGEGDEPGVCTVKPEACTLECADPGFCGCDGKLHCTKCQANSAGISLAPSESYCVTKPGPTGCGVPDAAACPGGQFCDQSGAASCGAAGVCRPKPEACDASCQVPMVCGCDGKEYCSGCQANSGGVSLAPDSTPCATKAPGCGVPGGQVCGANEFCDQSGAASCGAEGVCTKKPEACTEECNIPGFCGCDGKLHCTVCQANSAGVSIAPAGTACK